MGGWGGGGAEEGARVSELFFTKNLDVKKKIFFGWVGFGGRGAAGVSGELEEVIFFNKESKTYLKKKIFFLAQGGGGGGGMEVGGGWRGGLE